MCFECLLLSTFDKIFLTWLVLFIYILYRTLQCGACPLRARGLLIPDLARLSKLSTLNLEGQEFRGPLPQQWFEPDAWPQLSNMFLSENPIGGTLPASQTGSLRALTQLRINGCEMSGPLPRSWGKDETSMPRLSVLYVQFYLRNLKIFPFLFDTLCP